MDILRYARGGGLLVLAGLVSGASGSAQEPAAKTADARPIPEGLRFAHALLRDRRYDLAADQYERFLKTNPAPADLAEAHFGLGRARLFLNDLPAARREFEAVLQLAPDHPNAATALFRAGESAYLMGDLPAARKALEDYTGRYPDGVHRDTALPTLGDALSKLGDLPAARLAYEKALKADPEGRLANRTRLHLGRTLASLNEPDAAVAALDGLAERNDPEWSGKARLLAAQTLLSAGKPADALTRLEAIESLKPPGVVLAEVRLRRAEALVKLDRRDEAEAILAPLAAEGSKAVAPPAAFALAGSLFERGKWAECRSACDDAIRRAPESAWVPRLLYRSAEALAKEGNPAEARTRFLRVATEYAKDAWAPSALLRAARVALDASDPTAALALATDFQAKFPGNALRGDARLIVGRAALALNRPKEAIPSLQALLAEDKPTPELSQSASYYLGLAYKADGQAEKADAMLADLAKADNAPASADAKLVVGFNHFEAKRYDEAVKAFSGYLDSRPKGDDAPRALAYLALAHQELGQDDAAKAALDRLAKDWPRSDALPRARLILAESALEHQRYEDAAALFRAVAEGDDPKWKPRALSGLGWSLFQGNHAEDAASAFSALIAAAPADPLAADAALGRGRALEAAGKNEEALEALASVAKEYSKSPQVPLARLARARLLAKLGKAAEALDDLKDLVAHPPADTPGASAADLLVEWGWALHDAGKTAEADAAFRRILDEHPDTPRAADARVFLAESLHASGKTSEAAALLEPVAADGVQADPTLIMTALLRLGRIELARGDAAKAIVRFDRLLKDFPDAPFAPEAKFGKAEAELKLGKADSAEAQFAEIARAPGPLADPARLRRVQCLVALERWDDALAAADAIKAEGVALKPAALAELDYARGRCLAAGARFDEARAAYAASIEALPGSEIAARSQLMRGETYFHQKNYVEALREFHQTDLSYKAPEWQAAALLEAGKVYELMKRWPDAADVYEKFRSEFPKDGRIGEVEKRLAEVKKTLGSPAAEPGDAPPSDKPPGGE